MTSRHLLVAPIDWKPRPPEVHLFFLALGRHLLVAPIDWKHDEGLPELWIIYNRRHLLVAPIDWKPSHARTNLSATSSVAIYWWRLLTGNHELVELASVDDQWCRHLPVAPIDWKPIQFVNDPGNYGWESLVAGGAY